MTEYTFRVDGEVISFKTDEWPVDEKKAFPNAKEIKLLRMATCDHDPADNRKIAKWPIYSEAAGCAPSQIGEMKNLVPDLEHTPDGRAIFKSAQHRRECLKKMGMHDRAAFI